MSNPDAFRFEKIKHDNFPNVVLFSVVSIPFGFQYIVFKLTPDDPLLCAQCFLDGDLGKCPHCDKILGEHPLIPQPKNVSEDVATVEKFFRMAIVLDNATAETDKDLLKVIEEKMRRLNFSYKDVEVMLSVQEEDWLKQFDRLLQEKPQDYFQFMVGMTIELMKRRNSRTGHQNVLESRILTESVVRGYVMGISKYNEAENKLIAEHNAEMEELASKRLDESKEEELDPLWTSYDKEIDRVESEAKKMFEDEREYARNACSTPPTDPRWLDGRTTDEYVKFNPLFDSGYGRGVVPPSEDEEKENIDPKAFSTYGSTVVNETDFVEKLSQSPQPTEI